MDEDKTSVETMHCSTTEKKEDMLKDIKLSGDETAEELEANHKMRHLSTVFSHRLPKQVIYRGTLWSEYVNPQGLINLSHFDFRLDDFLSCGYAKTGRYM